MILGLDWGTDPDAPDGPLTNTIDGANPPLEPSTTDIDRQRSHEQEGPSYSGSGHT